MFGNARIRYQGQTDSQSVETAPVDVVVWERTTKRKVGDGNGVGFEDMARVTYAALRRLGQLDGQTFDEWLGSLAEYTPEQSAPSQPVADQPSD